MVATLNYVYSPVPRNRQQGSEAETVNVASAGIVAKTTGDLVASVQTDVSDATAFNTGSPGSVRAGVVAIGGPVWLVFGTNPTAVAAAVGAHYLPAGVYREFIISNGWRIAAIDA